MQQPWESQKLASFFTQTRNKHCQGKHMEHKGKTSIFTTLNAAHHPRLVELTIRSNRIKCSLGASKKTKAHFASRLISVLNIRFYFNYSCQHGGEKIHLIFYKVRLRCCLPSRIIFLVGLDWWLFLHRDTSLDLFDGACLLNPSRKKESITFNNHFTSWYRLPS